MEQQSLAPDRPIPFLRQLFDIAVATAHPENCLPQHLPEPPAGRTLVIGAGKAAAAMAQSVEAHWSQPLKGLVVTRYGHGAPCRHIEVLEAAHPVPDQLGEQAARRMLAAVADLGPDDLVLTLISGGGSSLLTLPAPGMTLADQQTVARALLRSGAPIRDINTVRTHLSAIKGGRLAAAAAPARVATLVISDVPDNDPALVASGPTITNASTPADALAILQHYAIAMPPRVQERLAPSQARPAAQMPANQNTVSVIATAADALAGARHSAEHAGVDVRLLGEALEGEARELGREHGQWARKLRAEGVDQPTLLLSGGETSVTVRGHGRGGRNAEYLLGLALALDGEPGIHALAADTDGIDGSQDNAGAVVRPDSLARAHECGLDANDYLARNDAYSLFKALDDLVMTGPTRTNVNDFRAILIEP